MGMLGSAPQEQKIESFLLEADQPVASTSRRSRSIGGRGELDDAGLGPVEPGDELWRREDYFVDVDPVKGGSYTLVYDKIRKFDLRYYPTPDKSKEREGLEEWDSRIKHGLPYAILMTIWLDVEEGSEDAIGEDREPHKIVRIILLRGAYNVRWTTSDADEGR